MKRCSFVVLLLIFFSFPSASSPYFANLGWVDSRSSVTPLLQYPQQLERLYHENNDQLIWTDMLTMQHFEQQLDMIRRANISPLFERQYHALVQYREAGEWFEYDLLATDTLLLYLSYAERAPQEGMTWFFEGNLNHSLPLPSEQARLALHIAVGIHGITDLIDEYTPQDAAYRQLVSAYRYLSQIEPQMLSVYVQARLKRPGDKLEDRRTLIQRLSLVNIDVAGISDNVTWYDNSLVEPVKQFQKMHGLKVDGIIGPDTLKWLNMKVPERLALLALNAERMRLWSTQDDTVIVVNVPGYNLKYWYSGKPVFESKVVVGRVTRPTPVMSTKLDSLILNPTWNVPHKIMVEDILPMTKRDASYLSRHHIDIIESWKSDQTLDPALIDWQNVNPKTFPYRMRQQAGNQNALGLYKFNTPNKRAIYLHDTPSKHLFNHPTRAFSSGCIRVEHADQFATALLETQGINHSELIPNADDANRAIPLKKRIPVHIIYQTVWYEGGEVHYRDDIYRLDRIKPNRG
ncbi:L,D-transpeptidase family protein [Vibrio furnissii]|uniref:L,D-transpeptidase family protein n=1 Tax=Vibrio furnissii TaxID=29494 RepID=UPI001EEC0227|nr:L,D-transpeptidase family protein [Vibrio furnissii]MCG6215060.1 L,D-transpeptidase family protein [Vibrio furnissii]